MTTYEIIQRKRDGLELSAGEVDFMVGGLLTGSVADYQMTAFLMAVYFQGMTAAETELLTRAMLGSGLILDTSSIDGPKVDKHSTGGVGDKLSFIAAPVAAAAGVFVPMISGRGLGHTGGTLDKLESIPGMSTSFEPDAFVRLVSKVGMAIVGQSPEVVPADRRIYALRDVTATVACVPLIVGSILSKKLAAGLDALALDVKVGRGAFMSQIESGRKLASALLSTAARMGLPAAAVLTDMDAPLGRTVGNALEVTESIDVLRGGGPADVRDTSLELATQMVLLGGAAADAAEAGRKVAEALDSGAALELFARFVEAQGGDARVVDDTSLLPAAPVVVEVAAGMEGHVRSVDALEIGLAAVELGAGRRRAEDPVNPAVGVVIEATRGARVGVGETIAFVHAATDVSAARAADRVRGAFVIGEAGERRESLVLEV
ncbi:thymidine phosphorylase, partial [bacterium]|nr:thymidine phosphorylase [bacterium]